MPAHRPERSRPIWRILLAAALATCICACGHDASKVETRLSGDERYLVARYVEIQAARRLYGADSAAAESSFAALNASVDTARVD